MVFFGSGPVGRATLENLLENGFEIEAIITKPWPKGHKSSMPVLEFAHQHKITVFTPNTKLELSELFTKERFSSRFGLVVDYGLIISKDVIESFPLGIINSHFSLLPEWRGPDPITFAILSGQDETGVSLMLINEKMDEGLLLAQEKLKIDDQMTTSGLTKALIKLSSEMLNKYLPLYFDGKLKSYPQPDVKPTYSHRLVKQDGILDLNKPAEVLEREVRAYDEWPKSKILLFGHDVIVIKSKVVKSEHAGPLVLKGNPGYLEVQELRAPSGRTISGADFLRGYSRSQTK